jgi:Divergent InlB B-repeat domain
MTAGNGGTVTPVSGWKNAASSVALTAKPTSNTLVSYNFTGWTGTGTGSFTGTTNPVAIVMGGPISETASFVQNPVNVTVQTNLAGLSFSVDGTPYPTPQTFSWQPGSSHTIATASPQSGATGVRYVWSNWSDKGTISHSVAPTQNTTYTAAFTTQYFLTMSAGTGGTVSLASGWKANGSTVKITATPATGYSFTDWTGTGTGSFSGTTNPVSITMGGTHQ